MGIDVAKKSWLADLVGSMLRDYDPAQALLKIPPELRGADPEGPSFEARARTLLVRSLRRKLLDAAASSEYGSIAPPPELATSTAGYAPLLRSVQGDIDLALDIALLRGVPFDAERRRAELATLLSALTGQFEALASIDPARSSGGAPAAIQKAFSSSGSVLKARNQSAGDPLEGLPLRVGVLCLRRRHVARLAIAYYGPSGLDLATARKFLEQAYSDTVLLIEALTALASAPGPLNARRHRVALAQLTRLQLPREHARRARTAMKSPRPASELAKAAPVRLRGFLLEQLLLAELAVGGPSPERTKALESFAQAAEIPPEQVAALQADAAELYALHEGWLGTGRRASEPWEGIGEEWEQLADDMLERVAASVTENLEAIVTEIKETGELGQLLAKAASGHTLTGEERVKVRAQLIDLAKAVPALAIFAAPGGTLLLPLLVKLLPFNVLPSAWNQKEKGKGTEKDKEAGRRRSGQKTATEEKPP